MTDDFTPFSEVQKMFPHSPTTTWRLFDKLKLQGKLAEGADADFVKTGGNLYIRLPRFFTELEAAGYKGVVSAIKKGMQVHADEINLKPAETSCNQDLPSGSLSIIRFSPAYGCRRRTAGVAPCSKSAPARIQ